jgi:hypothetical protein
VALLLLFAAYIAYMLYSYFPGCGLSCSLIFVWAGFCLRLFSLLPTKLPTRYWSRAYLWAMVIIPIPSSMDE